MTPAGYSGTPLPRKLGIRDGASVGTVGAPAHLSELLAPLPEDVRVVPAGRGGDPRHDVVLLFVDAEDALVEHLERLPDRVVVDGGLWVCWPKMKSSLFRGMKEDAVRRAGLATGMVDNKICAVDEDWSGLRFVFRKEERAELRARREETR